MSVVPHASCGDSERMIADRGRRQKGGGWLRGGAAAPCAFASTPPRRLPSREKL